MSVCLQITNVVMRGLGLWGRGESEHEEAPTTQTHRAVLDGTDAVAAALVDRLTQHACRTIRETSTRTPDSSGVAADATASAWLRSRTLRSMAVSKLASSPHPAGRGAALALSLLSPAVDEAAKNYLHHKSLRNLG